MTRRSRQHIERSSATCTGGCCKTPPYAYEVVPAEPSHLAWVFNSWLESYADNGIDTRRVRLGTYSALMTARMQRIVSRSQVYVAVEPDEKSLLYGFVVVELVHGIPTVHFAYVKGSRREHGLAAALVRHAFARLTGDATPPREWHFTHATYLGKHVAVRRGHDGNHNAVAAWDEAARKSA